MKLQWLVAIVLLLGLQHASGQTVAPNPTPSKAVASAAPAPTLAASTPTSSSIAGLEELRRDVASILATTARIAKTQEDEGSLLLKVRDGFLTNLLWELFGFKNTEKTLAGYAISVLGILGLVLKAVWYVSKKGKPEPAWVKAFTYTYMVLVVAVFSLLAFSGGVASEVPASNSAAKSLLDASSRMEANSEKLLLSIDDRLAKISAGLSPLPEGQEGATTKALAEITLDLKSVVVSSDIAAKMSTDAAGHPTGWGWHLLIALLLIALLLIGVLVAQAITHMKLNSK